ncbi:MAG: hypothetical protein P1V36_06555 [Planctomycetota bacterium]|nr:hypothetical protein [Planctomycetota bacterium]
MHWRSWTLATLTLALLAGCGGESGSTGASHGKPGDGPTSGELVKVAYDYGVGDGVRMTLTTSVAMERPGSAEADAPTEMTMVMRALCTEVRDNGDRVLEYVFESMGMPGGAPAPPGLEGMRGHATIDATGKMTDMTFEADDPMLAAAFKKSMAGGGLPSMVPFPPEGLRVGDAIDMKDMYPGDLLSELLSTTPGSQASSTMDGKLVLVGTRMIDGAQAAEFAVSMTMSMTMEMDLGGSTMRTDTTSTSSGRQFVDLKTGFPVGESTTSGTSTMTMSGGPAQAGDREMKSTSTSTCTCERLP